MSESLNLSDATGAREFVEALRARGDIKPGCLVLTLADSDGRPITGIAVDDLPPDPPQHDRIRLLGPLLRGIAQHDLCSGLLLAVGRRGAVETTGSDLAWHDALAAACRVAGLTCLGTFAVTPGRSIRVVAARPETAA